MSAPRPLSRVSAILSRDGVLGGIDCVARFLKCALTMTAAIGATIADAKLDIHPCLLVAPDDRFNPPRCVQRVKTAVCLNTRNTITPTKNDSSAISTHTSRINAKDK